MSSADSHEIVVRDGVMDYRTRPLNGIHFHQEFHNCSETKVINLTLTQPGSYDLNIRSDGTANISNAETTQSAPPAKKVAPSAPANPMNTHNCQNRSAAPRTIIRPQTQPRQVGSKNVPPKQKK